MNNTIENILNYYTDEKSKAIENITEAKEEIKNELIDLRKTIQNDRKLPEILKKIILENKNNFDLKDELYEIQSCGIYNFNETISNIQRRLINAIPKSNLASIDYKETSNKEKLIKEILASNLVIRSKIIVKTWNQKWRENGYSERKYYEIPAMLQNLENIKSIVIFEKDKNSLNNIENSINKTSTYFKNIANINNNMSFLAVNIDKNNLAYLSKFIFEIFVKNLKLQDYDEKEIIEKFETKLLELEKIDKMFDRTWNIKNTENFGENLEQAKRILKNFEENLVINENKKKENEKLIEIEKEKKIEVELENKVIINRINEFNDKIFKLNEQIDETQKYKKEYEEIEKSKIKKLFKEYKDILKNNSMKYYQNRICKLELEAKDLNDSKSNYITRRDNNNIIIDTCNEKITKYETENEKYNEDIRKTRLKAKNIELLIEISEKYRIDVISVKDKMDLYNLEDVLKLKQEIFELALKINELYIIKHKREIENNLKLFIDSNILCEKYYSNYLFYPEKQETIKMLWNTFFLCFPVITTNQIYDETLFPIIQEYIDLLIIDNTVKIQTFSMFGAFYKSKRLLVVSKKNENNERNSGYIGINKYKNNLRTIIDVISDIKINNTKIVI